MWKFGIVAAATSVVAVPLNRTASLGMNRWMP